MSAWDWQAFAACRGMDVNLFFGYEGERYTQDARDSREAEARAVCASCPVAAECRTHATGRPEQYGIWAGESEEERAARRRREVRGARVAAQRRDRVAS
jgi:WhiB family redox-sensing transcriptional regulator